MGGNAFANGPNPLNTPRMPPKTYAAIQQQCREKLRTLFQHVTAPIDGPAKKDFGDVDILVEGRREDGNSRDEKKYSSHRDLMMDVGELLGAKSSKIEGANCSSSFAIPWPSELHDDIPAGRPVGEEFFIQVDVRVCKDQQDLEWYLFKHAHGDFWNMLGSTIRPLGLTIDEEALYIRIPEVEKFDKNKAKVKLTDRPKEVLDFIGLEDDENWQKPFDSAEDMFDYVASSRLFWVNPPGEPTAAGMTGGKAGLPSLKANDRQRRNRRPMFRKWIDEFIPHCQETGRCVIPPTTTVRQRRDEVRREAFERFGVEEEYTARRDSFLIERDRQIVYSDIIKKNVPMDLDPWQRSAICKALRAMLIEGSDRFGRVDVRKESGRWDMDKVREVVSGWEGIQDKAIEWWKEVERERNAGRGMNGVEDGKKGLGGDGVKEGYLG